MCRINLKFFRNGGEEFSVVIHNYSLDQSVKLAENIRSGVENHHSIYQTKKLLNCQYLSVLVI